MLKKNKVKNLVFQRKIHKSDQLLRTITKITGAGVGVKWDFRNLGCILHYYPGFEIQYARYSKPSEKRTRFR